MITEFFTALQLELQDRAWDVQLGDEYLSEQSSPPRIVIYPVTESFERPTQSNTVARGSSGATLGKTTGITKSLLKRSVRLEAALWGCDYDQVELELLPAFIAALDNIFSAGAITYNDGRWISEGGFQEFGRLLIVPFIIPVKVVAPAVTLATVLTVNNNGYLEPGKVLV